MINKIQHNVKKHMASMENASNGFLEMFATQLNFRIECIAGIIVIITSFLLRINEIEWVAIILSVASVLVAETFNTSIERSCDAITRNYNEDIKSAKDTGAAAVLITAGASVIIGLIIFLPKIAVLVFR